MSKNIKFKKPELLAPAGNLAKLKIGLKYGADAFYLGMPSFSMRSRTNNFTMESLMEGVRLIREAGKKFYLTVNIYPRGNKVDAFIKHIEFIRTEIRPDALILADAGVFSLFKEYYPEAVIHMSVQSNLLNYRAVKFWQDQGVDRVILPRELMLSEISEIIEKVPNMEIETFVHGAICMAYSGRCLLSNYMTGRDANQGICAHSCRWEYRLHNDFTMDERVRELKDGEVEDNMYLEEKKRPGEFMPIEEDEHGTYIMNSKDMCLIPHLRKLYDAGVCSFKIEGRNKTEHYLGTVVKAYRKAIDDMYDNKDFDEKLVDDINRTANRGFIPGFIFGFPGNDSVYLEAQAPEAKYQFVGVLGKSGGLGRDDLYEIVVRNKFVQGEEVEIMTEDDQFTIVVDELFDLDGEAVEAVHGGAGMKYFKLLTGLTEGCILRRKKNVV